VRVPLSNIARAKAKEKEMMMTGEGRAWVVCLLKQAYMRPPRPHKAQEKDERVPIFVGCFSVVFYFFSPLFLLNFLTSIYVQAHRKGQHRGKELRKVKPQKATFPPLCFLYCPPPPILPLPPSLNTQSLPSSFTRLLPRQMVFKSKKNDHKHTPITPFPPSLPPLFLS
jgi:hypothetical protein